MSFHETFVRDDQTPRASERSFGLVMAGAFALVAIAPLVHGHPLRIWALLVAGVFGVAALSIPRVLAPLNHLWTLLGRGLHAVMSPLVMGLLFALVVVPTGLMLRLVGKDPLRVRLDKSAVSYWQLRDPPGPAPGSLKQQF